MKKKKTGASGLAPPSPRAGDDASRGYPSKVKQCSYGYCLVAAKDIPEGTVVEKFEGTIVPFDSVSEAFIRHIILWDAKNVMVPETPAQFANHSCDPNSYINDAMEIVTMRALKQGDEITFSYNVVYEDDFDGEWDPRWTFKCMCGARNCQGMVDKYVPHDACDPGTLR
jgi:hypothetical protein